MNIPDNQRTNVNASIRIAGVNIPSKKKLLYSLTYIYGVGMKISADICKKANIDPERRTYTLTEDEVILIANITNTYILEEELRKQVSGNIKKAINIKSYRGSRHFKRLPVRGQNTKNNARTRKGVKGSAITNKKKPGKK